MEISSNQLAQVFAALGHSRRINVFEHLLRHAATGMNFGKLQEVTKMPPSTLTHHLREMERSGVLIREVTGRSTNLKLDLNTLQHALNHLIGQCCSANLENPK